MPDDVLARAGRAGGVVMVNFYSCYLVTDCDTVSPAPSPAPARCGPDETRVNIYMQETATISDVVRHINHIRLVVRICRCRTTGGSVLRCPLPHIYRIASNYLTVHSEAIWWSIKT